MIHEGRVSFHQVADPRVVRRVSHRSRRQCGDVTRSEGVVSRPVGEVGSHVLVELGHAERTGLGDEGALDRRSASSATMPP